MRRAQPVLGSTHRDIMKEQFNHESTMLTNSATSYSFNA